MVQPIANTEMPAAAQPVLPVSSRATQSTTFPGSSLAHLLEQLEALIEAEQDYAISPPDYDLPAGFLLSIIVPVYNERQTIGRILARLAALPLPVELIVVDDGSTDGTRDLLAGLPELPGVRILMHPENRGKGAAVRTGIQAARGTAIMIQDADLEYDPADIPRLLKPLVTGDADVVYGSRFLDPTRGGSTPIHQFGNRMLTLLSNLTTGLRLSDMETCYKLFRRSVLEDITLRQDRFGFEPEITAKVARRGARLLEMPVSYQSRSWKDGKKIGIRDAVAAIYCIVRYAWKD